MTTDALRTDAQLSTADAPSPGETVSFTEMQRGTQADYELLDGFERQHAVGVADRLLGVIDRLDDSLGGYQISRKQHSLQSATRARRAGADIDWVVATLLHDIGDDLAPYNHAEYAAAVLRPYVREEVSWVIEHHGVFQSYYFAHHLGGDRDRREEFREHPWFDLCAEFCAEWDQNSFDPAGPIDDLASFNDDVHAVFVRPAWDAAIVATGSAKLGG